MHSNYTYNLHELTPRKKYVHKDSLEFKKIYNFKKYNLSQNASFMHSIQMNQARYSQREIYLLSCVAKVRRSVCMLLGAFFPSTNLNYIYFYLLD